MKYYKNVFSALATKGGIEVYLYIYHMCKTEQYPSFEDIRVDTGLKVDTLRRLTNRLSRYGLIYSSQIPSGGRQRVFKVTNSAVAKLIESLCMI